MSTPELSSLRRYRGVLVWIEAGGTHTRHGLINRAILRSQGLTIEVTAGGRSYDVRLHASRDGFFEGTWTLGTRGRKVDGRAECRLSPCGAFLAEPGEVNLKLEGVWHEGGSWDWIAKLRPLDAPETS